MRGILKFENIFGLAALLTLSAALFYFSNNADVVNQIILVLTNITTSVGVFYFTKHQAGE